jgi:hypothetical protein
MPLFVQPAIHPKQTNETQKPHEQNVRKYFWNGWNYNN